MTAADPWLGRRCSGLVLERLLGRGGMGAAYLARGADGAPAVVKLLAPGAGADASLLRRLRREADALRRVRRHPNLVAVLGAAVDGPEPPHLVLELVPGRPLGAWIAEAGRLAPADAARVARDVARGLAVLHGHGIIHRDVKPDNVVVTPEGRARLIDFGVAKDAFMSALTAPGQLVGTAEYMAPEQWTGAPLDARCDLFALGATLYHALTGQPPFAGDTLEELMDLATAGEVAPPSELAPGLPPDLERVTLHLLEATPRFRYARAERAAQDLDRVLRGEPPEGPPCLVELDGGARHPLLPGRHFLVGAAPGAQVRLPHPSVAPEHAELRRTEDELVLHDLRSPTGTWVGDERVARARAVEDGDVLRVGDVRLALRDPDGRRAPPGWLEDLEREERPDAVVGALARTGDARALAALLELLEPDPLVERAAEEALRAVDPAAAPALLARRARLAADARAAVPALLQAASGEALGLDPVAWLSWWWQARGAFTRQVGPARPPRALRLVPAPGEPVALVALGPEPGLLLIGRDARCQVRLEHPTVSRLHAAALRLHRRLVLRDEGGAAGTRLDGVPLHVGLLDPGAALRLGEVSLVVEGRDLPAEGPRGARLVDAATFHALDEAGHPATLVGHLAVLEAAARLGAAPAESLAHDLHPGDAARAAAVAHHVRDAWRARVGRARQALEALLGRDAGPEPAAWADLASRAGPLPPQVAPAGWV